MSKKWKKPKIDKPLSSAEPTPRVPIETATPPNPQEAARTMPMHDDKKPETPEAAPAAKPAGDPHVVSDDKPTGFPEVFRKELEAIRNRRLANQGPELANHKNWEGDPVLMPSKELTKKESDSLERVIADLRAQEKEKFTLEREEEARTAWKIEHSALKQEAQLRKVAMQNDLVGLAFSGGGIRSATFGLGVLQALSKFLMLRKVDYLSTVSGGGYLGAWLSAWIKREIQPNQPNSGVVNVEKQLNPSRVDQAKADRGVEPTGFVLDAEPEPIGHLRAYSNYLSPKLGLYSADGWSLVGIFVRNLLANQLVFLLGIVSVLFFGAHLTQCVCLASNFRVFEASSDWLLTFGLPNAWGLSPARVVQLLVIALTSALFYIALKTMYQLFTDVTLEKTTRDPEAYNKRVRRRILLPLMLTAFGLSWIALSFLDQPPLEFEKKLRAEIAAANSLPGTAKAKGKSDASGLRRHESMPRSELFWSNACTWFSAVFCGTGQTGDAKAMGESDSAVSRRQDSVSRRNFYWNGALFYFVLVTLIFGLLYMFLQRKSLGTIFSFLPLLVTKKDRAKRWTMWREKAHVAKRWIWSAFSAGATGGSSLFLVVFYLHNWTADSPLRTAIWTTFAPPAFLGCLILAVCVQIILLGPEMSPMQREWWSSLGGLGTFYAIAWAALFALPIFGTYWLLPAVGTSGILGWSSQWTVGTVWTLLSGAGIRLASSAQTNGKNKVWAEYYAGLKSAL